MTKEQLGSLVIASEDVMYHVAKTMLRNDADCADAIQETIVKAFSKIHTLKVDTYAKTWLIRILINECYAILRSNQRLEIWKIAEFEQTDRGYTSMGEFENSEGRLIKNGRIQQNGMQVSEKEKYSELYEALERLPEEMRLTVTLFYLEGYQIKEIASILNTTESTIKNRLLRARNRLKKDLEEMEAAGL